jgi:hypothetical protein
LANGITVPFSALLQINGFERSLADQRPGKPEKLAKEPYPTSLCLTVPPLPKMTAVRLPFHLADRRPDEVELSKSWRSARSASIVLSTNIKGHLVCTAFFISPKAQPSDPLAIPQIDGQEAQRIRKS